MPVNGIVILLAFVCMWNGYRKGLLRSLLSLAGTVASFYLAWMFSENLSTSMPLIRNTNLDPLLQTLTAQYYTLANRLLFCNFISSIPYCMHTSRFLAQSTADDAWLSLCIKCIRHDIRPHTDMHLVSGNMRCTGKSSILSWLYDCK